jgi:hypothetical protein
MNQLGNGPWFDSPFHFFTCDIWQEPTIEGYGQVAEGGEKRWCPGAAEIQTYKTSPNEPLVTGIQNPIPIA